MIIAIMPSGRWYRCAQALIEVLKTSVIHNNDRSIPLVEHNKSRGDILTARRGYNEHRRDMYIEASNYTFRQCNVITLLRRYVCTYTYMPALERVSLARKIPDPLYAYSAHQFKATDVGTSLARLRNLICIHTFIDYIHISTSRESRYSKQIFICTEGGKLWASPSPLSCMRMCAKHSH